MATAKQPKFPNPPLEVGVAQYPTPLVPDFYTKDGHIILVEKVSIEKGSYNPQPLDGSVIYRGRDANKWPSTLYLVYQKPEETGQFVLNYWANDRTLASQDPWNYGVAYSAENPEYPAHTRQYIVPRGQYEAIPLGSTDPVFNNTSLVVSVTVQGAGTSTANGTYTRSSGGETSYINGSNGILFNTDTITGGYWELYVGSTSNVLYKTLDVQANNWIAVDGDTPVPSSYIGRGNQVDDYITKVTISHLGFDYIVTREYSGNLRASFAGEGGQFILWDNNSWNWNNWISSDLTHWTPSEENACLTPPSGSVGTAITEITISYLDQDYVMTRVPSNNPHAPFTGMGRTVFWNTNAWFWGGWSSTDLVTWGVSDDPAQYPTVSTNTSWINSITVSGAGTALANGTYTRTANGYPFIGANGSINSELEGIAGYGNWYIYDGSGVALYSTGVIESNVWTHEYGEAGNEPTPTSTFTRSNASDDYITKVTVNYRGDIAVYTRQWSSNRVTGFERVGGGDSLLFNDPWTLYRDGNPFYSEDLINWDSADPDFPTPWPTSTNSSELIPTNLSLSYMGSSHVMTRPVSGDPHATFTSATESIFYSGGLWHWFGWVSADLYSWEPEASPSTVYPVGTLVNCDTLYCTTSVTISFLEIDHVTNRLITNNPYTSFIGSGGIVYWEKNRWNWNGWISSDLLNWTPQVGECTYPIGLAEKAKAEIIVSQQMAELPDDNPLRSRYVAVQRVYETISGPVITGLINTAEYGPAIATKQIVVAGTAAPLVSVNTIKSEVSPIDSVKSSIDSVKYSAINTLYGFQYDDQFENNLEITKTLYGAETPSLSYTGYLLSYKDEPINYYQTQRTVVSASNLPPTRTEYHTGTYQSPTLVFDIEAVSADFSPNCNTYQDVKIKLTPITRASQSRQTIFKKVISYSYGQPTPEDDDVFSPVLKEIAFTGYVINFNLGGGLCDNLIAPANPFYPSVPGAPQRGLRVHGCAYPAGIAYTYEAWDIPATATSASAYNALIGTYQKISWDSVYWKAGIFQNTTLYVKLI